MKFKPLQPDDPIIKTLNHSIKKCRDEITWQLAWVNEQMPKLAKMTPFVGAARTTYEEGMTRSEDRRGKSGPQYDLDRRTIEGIRDTCSNLLAEDTIMRRLTREKLALFGDIDFGGSLDVLASINENLSKEP